MGLLRRVLRFGFERLEGALGSVFPEAWNPLFNLGALGFFLYWIVAVSGIYVYIFFDTGISEAYESIEYMTNDQWYLVGVMRSLHRYAFDGLVAVMMIHLVREFSLDRYRGARWFTWVTGMPILVFVFIAGITGYWLVWDKLAQYVAIATVEWLDVLPIFGEPIARNFLTPESLDDRFFTLLVFMHIVVPLLLLLVLWIHLQRVSRPRINPPRGLAVGSFAMLLGLSLVLPATSQGPADLSTVPAVLDLDWFYLGLYPLLDHAPGGMLWGAGAVLLLMLTAIPWMPPMRRPPVAVVDLAHCNGCGRCVDDCPFNAVGLRPRTDGTAFAEEAVVDPALCVSCGICAGACPSSTPFRRAETLVSGIELPHLMLADMRERLEDELARLPEGTRIAVFACDHGADPEGLVTSAGVAAVRLPCLGMVPPPFIDFALARTAADGVVLAGCRQKYCFFRFGAQWTEQRIAATRDPYLRKRVPRERIAALWAGKGEAKRLALEIDAFAASLAALPAEGPPPASPEARLARTGSDG